MGDCNSKPKNNNLSYDYDLIVIGGGSGGIACAKEAAAANQRVLLADFVNPSPMGSVWGLGGTCTNVGCVPKKLFHIAALCGETIKNIAPAYGFTKLSEASSTFDWDALIGEVQSHIHSLNWKYKMQVADLNIKYENSYASFVDEHTVQLKGKDETKRVTGNYFLLAIGGRPNYLNIPGGRKEDALCITSDDLFSLSNSPGKTLIVGGGYVAMECGGFLSTLNMDVTIMVRSKVLRGFDSEMAERVQNHMMTTGAKFIVGFEPTEIRKEGEFLKVMAEGTDPLSSKYEESFKTVILAVGRDPCTKGMGLAKVGVKLNKKSGKVEVNSSDQTNVKHIYAVGDCAEGRPELAPVAIQGGKLLAKRLFRGERTLTDYTNVPTTIYTPLEYGCVGLSEEAAVDKFGKKFIVYHGVFQPIEYTIANYFPTSCYLKLICLKNSDQKVLGVHYFGPNAGEVIQGFALGLKTGAKKKHFDSLIGIHPTCAERFTVLSAIKGANEGEELNDSC